MLIGYGEVAPDSGLSSWWNSQEKFTKWVLGVSGVLIAGGAVWAFVDKSKERPKATPNGRALRRAKRRGR